MKKWKESGGLVSDKKYFKRAFIRKIAYILATCFMFLLMHLFNISILKADTVSYSNTRMDIYQCEQSCNVQGTNCIMDNCIWDSGNPPQETVTFGSSNGHMKKLQFVTRTNSGTWNSGTYHMTMYYYTTPFSMSTYTDSYQLRFYTSPNYNLSSYVEGISNYISFYNCSITQRGGSGNGFDLTCDFGVTQPIKNVMVEFDYKEANPNVSGLPNSESAWYGGISQFTTSTDSTGAINSQTTVIQNNFNETNQNINNINDTMNDDSVDDPNSFFEDMEDFMPNNGVITQLLGLPITLYTKILNSINGTCTSFSLGSLYNTDLVIPCIDVSDYLGSTLWGVIDAILSGFLVLGISRKFIKAFNNFTSLKEGDVIND